MALSRIERWTREVLELEAKKRGVRDVEVRSRGELLGLILRHDYASTHSLRSARKWVDALIDTASLALPLRGLRNEPPRTSAPPAAHAPRPSPRPNTPVPPPTAAGVSSTHASTQPAAAAAPSTRAAAAPPARELDSSATITLNFGTVPGVIAATPASAAVSGASATSATARAANRGMPVSLQPSAVQPTFNVVHTASDDQLEFARGKPGELRLRWRISDAGTARARAVLQAHGELTVRLVSVRTDPESVICSETTEHGPIAPSGEWSLQLATPSTHCVTAIGLRSAERFVSIVHATSRG